MKNKPGLASVAIAATMLSGCVGWPWNWGTEKVSRRDACLQAQRMGWCYDSCPERLKPVKCQKLELISCNSGGMCMWRAADGSIVFGFGQ